MQSDLFLAILGSFISLLLMVNAYFTRETLLRVVRLEVKLESNATKHHYVEKQVNAQELVIKSHEAEILKLRDKYHSLGNTLNAELNIIKLTIDDLKEIIKER